MQSWLLKTWKAAFWLAGWAVLIAASDLNGSPPYERVLLITVDGLRADAVSGGSAAHSGGWLAAGTQTRKMPRGRSAAEGSVSMSVPSLAGRSMLTMFSDHLGSEVVRSRISWPSGINTLVTYIWRLRRVDGTGRPRGEPE